MPQMIITAEEPEVVELCRLYWEKQGDKWALQVHDLAARYGKQSSEVSKLVSESSFLASDEVCQDCDLPIWRQRSRSHYVSRRMFTVDHQTGALLHWDCNKRRGAEQKRADELEQERRVEAAQAEARTTMAKAWADGAYRALDDLEVRYLSALIRTCDPVRAQRTVGLTNRAADALEEKLESMGLITADAVPDNDTAAPLLSLIPPSKPLKIIPSAPAQKVYRALAAKHAFVFPEVSLAAFVNRDAVQHLMSAGWHGNYFLMCRIDFVVCNADFTPDFAVEYQGGGHQDQRQKEKDEFKATMLEAAGVRCIQVDARDLNSLDEVLP